MIKVIDAPEDITVAYLQVVLMPNGEIISCGRHLGWLNDDYAGKFVYQEPESKALKAKDQEGDS